MRVVLSIVGVLVAIALVAGGILYWQYSSVSIWGEVAGRVSAETVVEVPPGTGPKGIAELLAKAGAVDDAERFYRYVRWVRRVGGRLKAGEYAFRPDAPQTPAQIVERLMKGEVRAIKVTIPEGLRLDEQAALFEAAGVAKAAELVKLARDATFSHSLGIEADSLEGYLFPDTYQVPRNATAEQVLRWQVERFRKAWSEAESRRASGIGLTLHQGVTLASIVEKETGQPQERPRISCVFHNRLRKDMKLQTDPTVIYAKILRTGSYDGNIRKSDLEAPHPYNTYAVKGLPPGPIANAGEAALVAALSPITCEDLFFVSRNDGTHIFCPTLACHEAAVETWQRAFFRKKRADNRR